MLEGLRKPTELIMIVVTLLAYGRPVQAVVHAFGLDERTVANWRDRAGQHCKQVHHHFVEQGQLDLVHVQADEMRVKGRQMIVWMGLAKKSNAQQDEDEPVCRCGPNCVSRRSLSARKRNVSSK